MQMILYKLFIVLDLFVPRKRRFIPPIREKIATFLHHAQENSGSCHLLY